MRSLGHAHEGRGQREDGGAREGPGGAAEAELPVPGRSLVPPGVPGALPVPAPHPARGRAAPRAAHVPQRQAPPVPPLLLPAGAGGRERAPAARAWPAPPHPALPHLRPQEALPVPAPATPTRATPTRATPTPAGHAHRRRPRALIGRHLTSTSQSALQK